MCNFWYLSVLLTTKFQECQRILKIHFKTILDLCCIKFLEPLDEDRLRFKSETCSKKMIKLANFSKIEIFKFGSNFQIKTHKKSNKSKKIFRCRLACRCRSRLGLAAEGGAGRSGGIFFWVSAMGGAVEECLLFLLKI